MFKLCIIALIILVPMGASAERIYGQITPTDDGAYVDLRSSDGSSATITTSRDGSFDIYTTRSTEQFTDDLERSTGKTRQAIESLNGDRH